MITQFFTIIFFMFLTTVVVYYIADTYRNKSDIFETYEIQSDLPSFIFGKPFWNDDYIFNKKKILSINF